MTLTGLRAATAASLLLAGLSANASVGGVYDFVSKPDGTAVAIHSTVTAAWPGFFYVQQADRAAGIRVLWPETLAAGDEVKIEGTLGKDGPERAILASRVTVTRHNGAVPPPLRFILRELGGATLGFSPGVPGAVDPYNVGLHVRVTGDAREPAGNPPLPILDAGANTVRVEPGALVWPRTGSLATVTGISSLTEADGNVQPLVRATEIRVAESTSPDTAIASGPEEGAWLAGTEATFTFTGTDDTTAPEQLTFSWQIDEGAWSEFATETTANLTALADGSHVFRVKARDAAGNVDENPAERTFSVDTTAPDTAIASGPEEGGWLASAETAFTFTGTDELTPPEQLTFSWQIDEVGWTDFAPETTANLTGLAGGAHTFRVKARDAAGNVDETPAERAFSVDTTAPSGLTVTDDGDTTTSHTQLHALWAAEDPESGIAEFQCAIGTASADPGSGYIVDWKSAGTATEATETGLTLESGQTYYWYVKARNAAGLWSEAAASNGITVEMWLPTSIMFVGDSLTQGLFASTEAKTFVPRTMAKLEAAYPQRTFEKRVMFGTDGSPMRTIASVIRAYNGPWPDVVVIQDAATQSSPMTGGATNGLAIITTDASGRVTSAKPDPATPGSGYQWKYPGESSALGVYVTFKQGANTSAGGLATISPTGVPSSYQVHSAGSGYDSGQPVQVLTDDWLALAQSAVDDVLTRWGTPERRPLVLFAGLWQQPKALVEFDGFTMNWNDHWARILNGPQYAGKVFHVPEFGSASYEPWALGWYYQARCDGSNTWVFAYKLPFDPTGKELYLRDGRWASQITSWDGERTITTKEPRGIARTDPGLIVNLVQATPWYTTYGDGYHPTDAGHEALGQGVFDALQRAIAARNRE